MNLSASAQGYGVILLPKAELNAETCMLEYEMRRNMIMIAGAMADAIDPSLLRIMVENLWLRDVDQVGESIIGWT